MKKLLIFIFFPIVLSSCMTTKEADLSKASGKNEKRIKDQLTVKNAVDSRKFIIKLNRIYSTGGGMVDLVPRANFIIVDGDRAVISTAYLGRQFDIRPIAAINLRGRAEEYAVTSKPEKGSYDIKLKIGNEGSVSFNVFLFIGKNGYCSASVSSLKIDNIRYTGYLVPIPGDNAGSSSEGNSI